MLAQTVFLPALLSTVSAHQIFRQLWINDVTPGSTIGIRMPPNNSPVVDLTSNDMACNVGGSKVPSGVKTIPAKEGDTIKVQWDQSAHPGPIINMLFGPVDDASQATGIGAGWFKIDELDNVNGKWSNDIMRADNMTHKFKLPMGLASGEYLLRSEKVAIHNSMTIGGTEFYMGCAQLKITGSGSGSGSCGPKISIPGEYKPSGVGILIPNFYDHYNPATYTGPGGPIAKCGGSNAGAYNATVAPKPTSPSCGKPKPTAPAKTPAKTAVSSTFSTVFLPAPTGYVPASISTGVEPAETPVYGSTEKVNTKAATQAKKWDQCGGTNFSGPTECESGTKCVALSTFYSHCID